MNIQYSSNNMDTPEIRKGAFVYRDTLFVDLGSNKRHPRASPQDLKDLLLPKSGATPKDQVAHWYEAQLIHYGLPRSKDKNTAKVRLTNAITSKTLDIPKDIVAMESEMKKDYASAMRKAKSAAMKAPAGKEVASKTKKSTSKTTVELEIDGMKIKIDREAIEAAKKKTGKAKEASPKTKGAKASDSKAKAAAKQATPKTKGAKASDSKAKSAAKSSPAKPATVKSSPLRSTSIASTPRTKQTARRGKPDAFYSNNGSRPSASPSKIYDHTPSSFRNDTDMDDAPPSYESIAFSHREETSRRSNAVQISGTYFFPRPSIHPFELTLQIDKSTQKLWGRFQIGSKEGVLRMDDISRITSGDAVSFGWRSEDQDDGYLKFGRGCDGTMSFDGEGWVKGHFKSFMYVRDVEFEGNLVNEDGLDIVEMKRVWDEFLAKAYGNR
ncbi:hypothetical protein H2200_001438 [Cladophialophora chaetospira]|uniref:Uncharacterized protein n=1 Tax=Cladophialophora chaetospira TaxID=386627 RepID=A0AA38XL05_9EURO|nr:hypothetical protein H2200_001438 [Cladophialophora chaetospira]